MSILEVFGIDWKLLLAQVINLGILVFVFKKFFWEPFQKISEERRKKIEKGISLSEKYQKKLEEIQEKEKEILRKAQKKAEEILKKAEEFAQKKEKETRDTLKKERERILNEIKKEALAEKEKILKSAEKEITFLAKTLAQKILEKSIGKEEAEKITLKLLEKK